MTDTLMEIDLNESPHTHHNFRNRRHPDAPMLATVQPGNDFMVELLDWAGGQFDNQLVRVRTFNSEDRINA